MAMDTPAVIAVLGAGPIGLEAALYGRYLGYEVHVYERGRIAEHVERWGHLRMFTKFGMNRSNLGLAALQAQDSNWQRPDDDATLTGKEYAERYLIPLAHSDLLSDSVHERTEVLAVGRDGASSFAPRKNVPSAERTETREDDDEQDEEPFRILLRSTDESGHVREHFATADLVIDATGTFGTPNWLGVGGIPALGEIAAQAHIEYGVTDVLVRDRDHYAGRSVLVVGDGTTAATNVEALAELARECPDTWITWITRNVPTTHAAEPVPSYADDPWAERARIIRLANSLAHDDSNHVTWQPGTSIEAVHWHADLDRFSVRLSGPSGEQQLEVDRVVGSIGYRADRRLFAELHVESIDEGRTSEPHFYILGAKSFDRDPQFTIAAGLNQIRRIFAIIADRESLDLYASVMNLLT